MQLETNAVLLGGDKPLYLRKLATIGVVAGSIGFGVWQFYLMRRYAAQKILPAPPLGMDQVVYLFETYQAATVGQATGAWHGLIELMRGAPAAGFGLQATAYAVMLAAGISRMSALAVNFAYFAATPGLVSLIVGRRQPTGFHL